MGGGHLSVGIFASHGIGDALILLKTCLAIKALYKAKVIFFGSKIQKQLIENFDFIDKFESNENYRDDPQVLETINSYHLDFIITLIAENSTIRFLKNTNAKCIIVRNKLPSVFSFKCKVVWHSFIKKFSPCNLETEMLYHFARKINPKLFDAHIKNLSLNVMIEPKEWHKKRVEDFLNKHALSDFIVINPFCVSTKYKLEIKDFLVLIQKIHSKYPKLHVVIPTFSAVHTDFIKEFESFDKRLLSEIVIFENNAELLNLCALLQRTRLLISLSTGAIHLASNLKIPSIGLFSVFDTIFWETFNKDYVLLTKQREQMSDEELKKIMDEILEKLEKYI